MAAARQTEGRYGLTALRLSDIPIAVRRAAAQPLIRLALDDANLMERVALERAVEFPSENVYWVPTDAVDRARRNRKRWT